MPQAVYSLNVEHCLLNSLCCMERFMLATGKELTDEDLKPFILCSLKPSPVLSKM